MLPPDRGMVHSITVSNGGVPKTRRRSAMVTVAGIEGDRQRDLRYHGGPDRAVCLFSWDLIHRLQAEGHSIVEGSIGENFAIAGIDWSKIRTGVKLQIGEVIVQITETATPCRNIAGAFAGPFTRVSQKTHPGWSRWYARVLKEGQVTVGDRVRTIVELDSDGS